MGSPGRDYDLPGWPKPSENIMPSLIAVLGLDGSGFKTGLNKATEQAQTTGGRIASALSSRVTAAISAIGGVGLLKYGTGQVLALLDESLAATDKVVTGLVSGEVVPDQEHRVR
jgi:hypothetical protein